MIAVPLFKSLLQKPTNVSHATADLVILPISFASGIMYLFNGYFDAELFIAVGLGVLAGGFFGAELLGKLSAGSITLIFAIIMFAAGLKMFFKGEKHALYRIYVRGACGRDLRRYGEWRRHGAHSL